MSDDELQGQPSAPVSQRKAQNTAVNKLTKDQIDGAVRTWSRTFKRKPKGVHVPYLVKDADGHLWANPAAFARTKKGSGYCTTHIKGATDGKWDARIPVHCIMWRYWNDCKLIPDKSDVSHLAENVLLLDKSSLHAEFGYINRSRVACHREGWYCEAKANCAACVRCPHTPPCLKPLDTPATLATATALLPNTMQADLRVDGVHSRA